MPTNRRRTSRNRAINELSPDQIMHFFHGWHLDNMGGTYYKLHGDLQFPFRDDEHRKELYFKHRDFLHDAAGKQIDGVFIQLLAGKKPKAFYDYEENKLSTTKKENKQ